MSIVHRSAFTEIARTNPAIPAQDWPETISDFLLGPVRLGVDQNIEVQTRTDSVGLIVFPQPSSDSIEYLTIVLVFAWTLWIPLTLLGLLIIQFSTSRPEIYRSMHIQYWVEAWANLPVPQDAGSLEQRKQQQKALVKEAFIYDYLYDYLKTRPNVLEFPAISTPILRDLLNSPEYTDKKGDWTFDESQIP
jgi:hypothetical protein